MNLPPPSAQYNPENEAQARAALVAEDRRNLKKGQDIIFSGDASVPHPAYILTSPDGTKWRQVIDNSGVDSWVPV